MDTKVLKFRRIHHLGKLHAELEAAIPGLRPITTEQGDRFSIWALSGRGDDLIIEVPEDTDEQAIATVLAAHDPTPPAPTKHRLQDVRDQIAAATTVPQVKAALAAIVDDLIRRT